jgi:hypothetical protein
MVNRLQEFMDGQRDFDDAITVEEYVVEVDVLPDGSVVDADVKISGGAGGFKPPGHPVMRVVDPLAAQAFWFDLAGGELIAGRAMGSGGRDVWDRTEVVTRSAA